MTGEASEVPPIVILAGPTASGKSSLALRLAAQKNGTIINADSQQAYRDLRILTDRPSEADEAKAPHKLYGHVPASERYSAGKWIRDAEAAIRETWEEGRMPILTGGSGLPLRLLREGMAEIPEIPEATRQAVWTRMEEMGTDAFAADLLTKDPLLDGTLDIHNPQRLMRAAEVWEHTGESITLWQERNRPPAFPVTAFRPFLLLPARETIYEKINARVPQMVEEDCIDEVRALLAQKLDPTLPAMKSHGVREFQAYLEGTQMLEWAIDKTAQITRHYAKRQHSWFKKFGADYQTVTSLEEVLKGLE